MSNFIRLSTDDTLKDLLGLLGHARAKIVYVEIPKGSDVWHPQALRLLKRAGREVEKKIVIISENRVSRIRAEQAGLTAMEPAAAASSLKSPAIMAAKRPKAYLPIALPPVPSPAGWISKKTSASSQVGPRFGGRTRRALFTVSLLAALLAGFAVANFKFQKAVITVFARSESKENNLELFADKSSENTNVANRVIQALPVAKILTKMDTFLATGKKESGTSARGTVNLISTHPTTLRLRAATTYLEAAGGKRFLFTSDVSGLQPNVPMPVEVVAEEGGQAGNMAAGTRLEVHNSAFGFRPTVLHAEVGPSGLTGGATATGVTIVTESDLAQAQESLKIKMIEELRAQVKFTEGESFVLLNDLMRFNTTKVEANAKAGDQKGSFVMSLTADLQGLSFDQKTVTEIADREARKSIEPGRNFLGVDTGSFNYTVRSSDFEKGIAALGLKFQSRSTATLEVASLKTLLAGRGQNEIKQILLKRPEIESVNIQLSPFWLRKTPKSPEKIIIKTEVK